MARVFRLLSAGLLSALLSVPAVADGFLQRDGVADFIDRMVDEHGFDRGRLRELFAGLEHKQRIIDAISRPAESKPWHVYRRIFLNRDRIQGGVEFWRRNAEMLARAEREYGVPAEILVAILGIESRYGDHHGSYRVMDALSTLGFDYPPRGGFFRSELEEFLLLSREEGFPAARVRGSYAGAMGMPQFISSSYRMYAVDFNGDGRRDLWHTHADAIGSVANYFSRHGWRKGEPIAVPAWLADPDKESVAAKLADKGSEPELTLAQLREAGIRTEADLPEDRGVSLIRLEMEDGPEYWIGLENFYVITRYNHSALYAMAVYRLSRSIVARREARRAG